MANTAILVANLAKFYLMQINNATLAYRFVNRTFESTLLSSGDTVKVKYFNNITLRLQKELQLTRVVTEINNARTTHE